MSFLDQLKQRAEEMGNIISFGPDPVLEKIPLTHGTVRERIATFFGDLIDGFVASGVVPAITKPNIAFFEQYGFDGLHALQDFIAHAKKAKIPVLLDAKRGDIGKTSDAYARAVFDFWGADAMTVAPYMGNDSVGPFIERCAQGKGVYVLVRTSNAGARDLQDLSVGGVSVYMKTAEKIVEWYAPGVGAVVGATYPAELEKISSFFVQSGKEVPLLIPGVGAQGGSAADVVAVLTKTKNPLWMHRINSSSGITYAYEKEKSKDYVGAAVRVINELVKEIGQI